MVYEERIGTYSGHPVNELQYSNSIGVKEEKIDIFSTYDS